MSDLISLLRNSYIRFFVWLGADAPEGYEHYLPQTEKPKTYTLKEGETIFSVARKFGVHYDLIAQANNIENLEDVQPGQTITIPAEDWQLDSESKEDAELPDEEIELPPETEDTEPFIESDEPVTDLITEESEFTEEDDDEIDWLTEIEEPEPEDWIDEIIETEAPAEIIEDTPIAVEIDEDDDEEPEWLSASTEPIPDDSAPDTLSTEDSAALDDQLDWLASAEPVTGKPQPISEETPVIQDELLLEEAPADAEAQAPTPVDSLSEDKIAPDDIEMPRNEMMFRYEVQRGDTLPAIAKRYAITVKEIVEANSIPDANRIFPGQKLVIPGYRLPKTDPNIEKPTPDTDTKPSSSEPDEFFVYLVAEGDTLNTIAKRYGVTVRQLVEVNNIQDARIWAGQRLYIPGILQASKKPETETPEDSPVPDSKPAVIATANVDSDAPPQEPDDAVRALYVSYFAIGHSGFREYMFNLLNTTEINAVVIDVKGDHGWISYPTQIPLAHEIDAARPTTKDFDEIMARLKAQNIYTIARIVTFKDNPLAKSHPDYALRTATGDIWQDQEDLGWSDPFLTPVWDYNIQLALEAAQKGFDEIQFDFLRFPTASQAGTPQYSQEVSKETRIAAITGFLSVARGQLDPFKIKLATNTFGYTCWREDDTLIGQDIDRMGQYLDVLSPMLYPSTFGSGIPNYKFAIAHPYEVVYESAKRAVERVQQFGCIVRPWIQDFPDYRFDKRVYGKEEIQAQIKGCFDAGGKGYMVWNPRVKYTDGAYAPYVRVKL